MRNNLPDPITKKTFENMVAKWAKITKYHECGSIYFYAKAGFLRRYHQLLNSPDLYKKYFGKEKINLIDAEGLVLEEEEDWQTALKNNFKKDSNIFFIIGMDKTLLEKNKRVLTFLEEKEAQNPNYSFLFFFNIDFSHPQFWNILRTKSVFIQNTIFHSLYKDKDTKQFINYLQAKWNLKIKKDLKQEITKNCKANFWLIKQSIRFLRNNPKATANKIFSSEQMQWRLKLLWNNFLPSEKKVFKKLFRNKRITDKIETHSLNFLLKTGWIKKNNKKYKITTPIFKNYIKQILPKNKLSLTNNKKIYLNNVPIGKNFSKNEKKILILLLKNRGKIVSREMIAKSLWGKNWSKHYSDWAIDQTISRLRKRLKFLGFSQQSIKTKRGKGFIYKT